MEETEAGWEAALRGHPKLAPDAGRSPNTLAYAALGTAVETELPLSGGDGEATVGPEDGHRDERIGGAGPGRCCWGDTDTELWLRRKLGVGDAQPMGSCGAEARDGAYTGCPPHDVGDIGQGLPV